MFVSYNLTRLFFFHTELSNLKNKWIILICHLRLGTVKNRLCSVCWPIVSFHANLTKTSVKPENCTNLCTKTYGCRRQFDINCTMADGGSLILLPSLETVFLLLGCLVQPQCEDFHLSYCILFHPVWPMSVGYILPFIWRLKKGNASGKEGRFVQS